MAAPSAAASTWCSAMPTGRAQTVYMFMGID